jgi:hypothetical protein
MLEADKERFPVRQCAGDLFQSKSVWLAQFLHPREDAGDTPWCLLAPPMELSTHGLRFRPTIADLEEHTSSRDSSFAFWFNAFARIPIHQYEMNVRSIFLSFYHIL